MYCYRLGVTYVVRMKFSSSMIFTLILGLYSLLGAGEELSNSLKFSRSMVSISAVDGEKSMSADLTIANTGSEDFAFVPILSGQDAKAFSVKPAEIFLGAGKKETLNIRFKPLRGAGSYEASLEVADGIIPVKGLGLKAFEGKNEPPLDQIVKALGIALDVGGKKLSLDTEEYTIGESIPGARFRGIAGEFVKVTPLARFSPPGEVPFGIVFKGEELIEWGKLQDSDETRPDSHQCLFPRMGDGVTVMEKEAPKEAFAFYMKGHIYVSYTDSSMQKNVPIKHSARMYPVKKFQGRDIENAYLIGFEEAKNGDYQDAVFLLKNVTIE